MKWLTLLTAVLFLGITTPQAVVEENNSKSPSQESFLENNPTYQTDNFQIEHTLGHQIRDKIPGRNKGNTRRSVPEPTTMILVASGIAGLGALGVKKFRRKK
ncbi:hypothetical protein CHISP_1039 [Chitinispirillum alkaliphilum]|nr:hypothetical protein CHISP_1039 [Chitinispirillum alkaliphilum]